MADQSQPPQDDAKKPPPQSVNVPEAKSMDLWDSFLKILRPDKKP
jgi:hypothetical protein